MSDYVCTVNTVLMDHDVAASVEGSGSWEDYGVAGSPRWFQIDAVRVTWPVVVDDLEYESEDALEAAHPGMEIVIIEYATESGDWGAYEEDYDE